jgi:hypothetical protein
MQMSTQSSAGEAAAGEVGSQQQQQEQDVVDDECEVNGLDDLFSNTFGPVTLTLLLSR